MGTRIVVWKSGDTIALGIDSGNLTAVLAISVEEAAQIAQNILAVCEGKTDRVESVGD